MTVPPSPPIEQSPAELPRGLYWGESLGPNRNPPWLNGARPSLFTTSNKRRP